MITTALPPITPKKIFLSLWILSGFLKKKWQFSADLIKKGFKILEVSDDSQFTEGNIPLLVEPSDKYILRAYKTGKPTIENGKVEINGKFYAPDN